MKKFLILIFISICLIVISGCDILPVYSVFITDEAIVTQDGEIIGGPKDPGLHFKIPFIQKVHMVKVHMVRCLPIPIQRNDIFEAKVLWYVQDSIKYFKNANNTADDRIIESKISPVFSKTINSFISDTLLQNSKKPTDNKYLSINDHEKIFGLVQKSSIDYGLNIVEVQIKKK